MKVLTPTPAGLVGVTLPDPAARPSPSEFRLLATLEDARILFRETQQTIRAHGTSQDDMDRLGAQLRRVRAIAADLVAQLSIDQTSSITIP